MRECASPESGERCLKVASAFGAFPLRLRRRPVFTCERDRAAHSPELCHYPQQVLAGDMPEVPDKMVAATDQVIRVPLKFPC